MNDFRWFRCIRLIISMQRLVIPLQSVDEDIKKNTVAFRRKGKDYTGDN